MSGAVSSNAAGSPPAVCCLPRQAPWGRRVAWVEDLMLSIRPIRPDELEAVRQLLFDSGWSGARMEPGTFAAIVERSQVALVAIDDERIVGFARALTDGLSNGYVSMVAVAPTHRRRGIGQALVRRTMGDDLDMTWVLRARPGSEAFYASLGFVASTVAMERVRRTNEPAKEDR